MPSRKFKGRKYAIAAAVVGSLSVGVWVLQSDKSIQVDGPLEVQELPNAPSVNGDVWFRVALPTQFVPDVVKKELIIDAVHIGTADKFSERVEIPLKAAMIEVEIPRLCEIQLAIALTDDAGNTSTSPPLSFLSPTNQGTLMMAEVADEFESPGADFLDAPHWWLFKLRREDAEWEQLSLSGGSFQDVFGQAQTHYQGGDPSDLLYFYTDKGYLYRVLPGIATMSYTGEIDETELASLEAKILANPGPYPQVEYKTWPEPEALQPVP